MVACLLAAASYCPAESHLDVSALSQNIQTPHKIGSLVVEPSFAPGAFDSHLVDCPFPFYHNGKYWMTYVGWDSIGYRTGWASSADLVHWQKEGLLLDRGPKGSPTEFNIALTCIVRDNDLFSSGSLRTFGDRYVGTYHAYPGTGYESGPASIGICTSSDLKQWQLEEPLLKPEPNLAWEAGGLYKSWLLENDGTWYLFYNAKNKKEHGWNEQIGVATSTDLKKWARNAANPILKNGKAGSFDEQFASDPCVFKLGEAWVMFYFGLDTTGHARDGAAFSKDLVNWEKSTEPLIGLGKPGSIDSIHAHKPGMIAKDGVLYHFYCAVSPALASKPGEVRVSERRGISLATGAR